VKATVAWFGGEKDSWLGNTRMLEHQQGLGVDGRWLVDSVARERAELGARAAMAAGGSVLAGGEALAPFIGWEVDRR
jgi:hypothetical protein